MQFHKSSKLINHLIFSIAIKPQVVAILKNLRPEGHPIDSEIQTILDEAKQDAALSGASWEEVFKCKTAVMIGCGLMFFQAATGINSGKYLYCTLNFTLNHDCYLTPLLCSGFLLN